MSIVFIILLALCSVAIAYQDFKERMISLIAILFLGGLNVAYCFYQKGPYQLLENLFFLLLYLLLSYCSLILFYFFKTKKLISILDSKIGWGDIFIMGAIGLSLEPVMLVFFFTASFILSILVQLLFIKTRSVPLAGIMAVCFLFYCIGVLVI